MAGRKNDAGLSNLIKEVAGVTGGSETTQGADDVLKHDPVDHTRPNRFKHRDRPHRQRADEETVRTPQHSRSTWIVNCTPTSRDSP